MDQDAPGGDGPERSARPIDRPDLLLVLCPAIGHPRRFPSLGAAQLRACLEQSGVHTRLVNLSELLYRLDRPMYRALYDAGSLESFYHLGVWGDSAAYLDRILGGEHDADLARSLHAFVDLAAERIQAVRPGVVGLSLIQSNVAFCLALCSRLSEAGVTVIAGGPAARETSLVERLFEAGCRLVVTGEAEQTLPELMLEYKATGQLPGPGATVRGSQIADLDALPFPDFDTEQPLYWLPVASSRGCTCRCPFCEEATLYRGMRRRSVRRVVDEIAHNRERYRPRGVQFHDSLINDDRDWLLELTRTLQQEQPGLDWRALARPEGLDDELLEQIARSGCSALHFGIEHFSQPISDALDKRLDVDAARRTIERTATHGIPVKLLLIVGVPGETEEDHQVNLAAIAAMLKAHPGQVDLAVNPLILTPQSLYLRRPDRYGIQLHRDHTGRIASRTFEAGPDPDTIARYLKAIEALKPRPAPEPHYRPG